MDLLQYLYIEPPKKSTYKEDIITKITALHEKELRLKASTNQNIIYLNFSISGLRGRHHPALSNLITSYDVMKSQPHIKMLCNDYFTYEKRSQLSGGSSHCRTCSSKTLCVLNEENLPIESITHIITECETYNDIRERIYIEFSSLCRRAKYPLNFQEILSDNNTICQFVLDPSSMNLKTRINLNDPILDEIFKLSRDLCYSIHSRRIKILNEFKKKEGNSKKKD